MQRPRSFPTTISDDSALAQLVKRLSVRPAIGSPYTGPLVLIEILKALRADDWGPPKSSQAGGGRVSGERRRWLQTVRRIVVGVIMDNAPETYRCHPRSLRTHKWVYQELQKLLSSVWGRYSFHTIVKDVETWAYNSETAAGRQRPRKSGKPPRKRPEK